MAVTTYSHRRDSGSAFGEVSAPGGSAAPCVRELEALPAPSAAAVLNLVQEGRISVTAAIDLGTRVLGYRSRDSEYGDSADHDAGQRADQAWPQELPHTQLPIIDRLTSFGSASRYHPG